MPPIQSDSLGRASLPLFPFWRSDAKGGEVAPLGLGICMGGLSYLCIEPFAICHLLSLFVRLVFVLWCYG